MKIERKENSGLVEFGSLKCGDVFYLDCFGYLCMKIPNIITKDSETVNHVYIEDGDYGYVCESTLVKHYPNAKLVLED